MTVRQPRRQQRIGRHAEEAVRASESRLRAMLEAALDAVVTMDHQGCVVGWNHAATTTFGYEADEVIGREIEKSTQGIYPLQNVRYPHI